MKERTACFSGHRIIPSNKVYDIRERLTDTLINCIKNGYCYFGVGGALGFDTLVANTIISPKRKLSKYKTDIGIAMF